MLHPRYFFSGEFDPYITILEDYPSDLVTFQRGEMLSQADYVFSHMFLILAGFCRVSTLHCNGEERLMGYWRSGSIYPLFCTEEPDQRFGLESAIVIRAMTSITTRRYTPAVFKTILKEHPDIAYAAIDHYARETNFLFFRSTIQVYDSLKSKICSILHIYYLDSKTLSIPLTQQELSFLIGAKRESVVKVLRNLREENLIATFRNRIQILDIEGIMKMSSSLIN